MNIELKNITKSWDGIVLYDQFSFTFPENTITGVMGPSGSGKTTLLNLLSGVIKPDTGVINGIHRDKIAYIFQEDRLLPWRTVRENLRFVLKKPDDGRIDAVLKKVGLENAADLYPSALSGGMQKRVAIARAFCYPSEVLLMDEPFTGLDRQLKFKIMNDLKNLWTSKPITVIFVSHYLEELQYLCSDIYAIKNKPVSLEKIQE